MYDAESRQAGCSKCAISNTRIISQPVSFFPNFGCNCSIQIVDLQADRIRSRKLYRVNHLRHVAVTDFVWGFYENGSLDLVFGRSVGMLGNDALLFPLAKDSTKTVSDFFGILDGSEIILIIQLERRIGV